MSLIEYYFKEIEMALLWILGSISLVITAIMVEKKQYGAAMFFFGLFHAVGVLVIAGSIVRCLR